MVSPARSLRGSRPRPRAKPRRTPAARQPGKAPNLRAAENPRATGVSPPSPEPNPPATRRSLAPGRVAFSASTVSLAQESCARLVARYGDCKVDDAAVMVALGGDGLMLE